MYGAQLGLPRHLIERLGRLSIVGLMAASSLGIFAVLVASGVNGSSLSLLSTTGAKTNDVIVGHPRNIRSDEFALSTPLAIGNAIRGLPTTIQLGLTQTRLPALGNLAPTKDWTTLFRPENLGWLVLPLENAFAFHWWMPLVVGLAGLTWLFVELNFGRAPSVLLAVAGVASPTVVWWSLGPANVLGYGALATAAALRASRTPHWRTRMLWAASSGYWFICFALILYPPWQVSVGWILLGAFVGSVLDCRTPLRQVVQSLSVTAIVSVAVLALWYAQSSTAIKALAATIYPGHRITHSGGGVPSWLISGSFYLWPEVKDVAISGKGMTLGGHITSANLSEVSSAWIPLPVVLVIVLALIFRVWRKRGRIDDSDMPQEAGLRYTVTAIAATTALNGIWAYVPGVDFVGSITLLNREEGARAPLAIGLGVLLLLGLATRGLAGNLGPAWHIIITIAVLIDVWLAIVASGALHWLPAGPNAFVVGAGALILALSFWLAVASRKIWGLSLLAVVAVSTTVVVNPLVHGLGPLRTDPVVKLLTPIANTRQDRVVAIGALSISDLANASGVSVLSGLTYYPDPKFWEAVDHSQIELWNNYAQYQWAYDPSANPVRIDPRQGSIKPLRVNLCDVRLKVLQIDWVISNKPVPAPCLSLSKMSSYGNGKSLYLYRYAS